MKYLITFTALIAANALQHLSWPVITGVGITMFSGLFIYTVKTAHTPWRIPEPVQDMAKLAAVLILFFATAVCLVALADDGLSLMDVVKIVFNV